MKHIRSLAVAGAALTLASIAVAQPTTVVLIDGTNGIASNNDGILDIDSDVTLTADTQWILTEITYVTNGATLTIEPGTIIRGKLPSGPETNDPGALVVTRDGMINAAGNLANPIVFTTAALNDGSGEVAVDGSNNPLSFVPGTNTSADFLDADPINSPAPPSSTFFDDVRYQGVDGVEYRGLWGGVIILGSAPTSIGLVANGIVESDGGTETELNDPYEGFVEGIAPSSVGTRSVYGGSNPNDNSGVFRFVSIRHGGSDIGDGNEINGLTMGGVGTGTLIEFVEVYCNADDGFEWFGGTVNTRYLVSLFNNDDSFDIDEGFTGLGQFWFSLQSDDNINGNHGGEHDGTDANFDSVDQSSVNGVALGSGDAGGGLVLAYPTIYNATYIGGGEGTVSAPDSGEHTTFRIRDSFGGAYFNSIFSDFADYAVRVDDDGVQRFNSGDVVFRNNIWYNFGLNTGAYVANPTAEGLARDDANTAIVFTGNGENFVNNTTTTDPFPGPRANNVFDWRLGMFPVPVTSTGSAVTEATTNLEPYTATFFTSVGYKGAFDPTTTTWTTGWTAASGLGVIQ